MRTLITGSSGFIGKHLVKTLQHEIVEYDLVNGLDVLDMETLKSKVVGCDLVIHLAAKCVVSESWDKSEEYFKNNILGTENVKKLGLPVIFASSWVAENPTTPYAVSKLAGEMILKDHCVLRFFNVYGTGQNPSYGRVIDNFMDGNIRIYGDGEQVRDYVHVNDVCLYIANMVDDYTPGLYEVGTGVLTSVNTLAQMINPNIEPSYLPARDEPVACYGSRDPLKTFVSLEEGIKRLYATRG